MEKAPEQIFDASSQRHYSLHHVSVDQISGGFYVPRYQRGYRWDKEDVRRLLDDVWKSQGQEYNLQPIVIKLREAGPIATEWELIDGQQRLTTLFLIRLYLQEQGWDTSGPNYSLRYDTRQGSETYLRKPVPGQAGENIDYHHIYQAYQRIGNWFDAHGDSTARERVAAVFLAHLLENVRVIWYQAPAAAHAGDNEKDSTALFTRLNVGRIPLTDAELIKALLLSTVRKSHPERAQEIAAQWDGIERDLHNPDIWAFVSGEAADPANDKYPTRISLLLDSLADSAEPDHSSAKRMRYFTFETLRKEIEKNDDGAFAFWTRVLGFHARIVEWFETPSLHNKIGFLVANGRQSAKNVIGKLADAASSTKKTAFEALLNDRIRAMLHLNELELSRLSYANKNDQVKLMRALLLMNIETVTRTGQRFPFRRHVGTTWSLEHIHAQNSQGLTKVIQWKTWLKAHRAALNDIPVRDETEREKLLADIDTALVSIDTSNNFGQIFEEIAKRVVDLVEDPELEDSGYGTHHITNLALLSRDDNSALNNAIFEVKRQMVLAIDRNTEGRSDGYIPVCTRNVFLKYYPRADNAQVHFWGIKDRESYYAAIVSMLAKYLMPGVTHE